jgi:hypothetical protein
MQIVPLKIEDALRKIKENNSPKERVQKKQKRVTKIDLLDFATFVTL